MRILFVFLLLSLSAKSQDTICVNRSEMIKYAANSIELKTLKINFELISKSAYDCNELLISSRKTIMKQDSVIIEQAVLIDDISMQLLRQEQNQKFWRNSALVSLGAFISLLTINFIQ